MKSRRSVLRMGVVGSVAGLAGCTDVLSEDSTTDEPESGDGGSETTAFTKWLYDPDEIGASEGPFGYTDISGLLESDEFTQEDSIRNQYRERFGENLAVDSIEYALDVNSFHLLRGSFEGDILSTDGELEFTNSYGDFDIYTQSSGGSVFAASDEYLLAAYGSYGPDSDTRTELELMIDTLEGDQSRFIDESDAFDDLLGSIGSPLVIEGEVPTETKVDAAADDERVGHVTTQQLSQGKLDYVLVDLYPDEGGIDVGEIRSNYEDSVNDGVDITDVTQEGRLVTIRAEAAPEDMYIDLL